MKKITLFLLFITVTSSAFAQVVTLIDFGLPSEPTTGFWNNVTNPVTSVTNLVDDEGNTTTEVLTLTDAFDDDINDLGTQAPGAPASDWAVPQATRDNFFGENVDFEDNTISNEPTGGFTLSGLDATKYYSFSIFASRTDVEDNRETLYTITGSATPATATLDAANNTSNVATILNVQPNVSGEITILVQEGPANTNDFGFYYLGAIEMTRTDNVLSSKSFWNNGLVSVYPNPSSEFVKVSLNLNTAAKVKMDVYDLTGKLVKSIMNEDKSAGAFVKTWNRSGIASGLYILKIDADGRTHNSKLLLK